MWTYKLPRREIKFRGVSIHWWRVYWYYVYSSVFSNTNDHKKHLIILENWEIKEIEEWTATRYTNTHDKKWVEIYEGDIVSAPDGERDYFLPVTISPYRWVMFWVFDHQSCSFSLGVEVVGNVFENIDQLDNCYIAKQADKTL